MNVAVVSHRRSGTHLTIDLIRNNFPAYGRPYISDREIHMREEDTSFLLQVAQEAEKCPHVIKSHHVGLPEHFFGASENGSLISELIKSSRLIYVYRDPRDVLVSLYFHLKAEEVIGGNHDLWPFITGSNTYYSLLPRQKR